VVEMDCELGLCLCSVSIVVALLLLVDNKLKHSDPGDSENYINDRCEQWFQWRLYYRGDLRFFCHETGIVFFTVSALLGLLWWTLCE